MKMCRDDVALDAYVSGELDAKAAASMAAHLASCRRCASEVATRSEQRRELAEALGRNAAGDDTDRSDAVRRRVFAVIERPDSVRPDSGPPDSERPDRVPPDSERPDRVPPDSERPDRVLPAARARNAIPFVAAVVIAAAAGWWSALALSESPASRDADALVDTSAYADALVNHLACGLLQRFPEGATEAQSRQRLGPYAAIFDTVTDSQDFELVHAHICPNRSRRFGHLVLRHRGETVSVLVTDKSDGAGLPAADRNVSHAAIAGVVDFPIVELSGLETNDLMGFIATPKRGFEPRAMSNLATELELSMRRIESHASSTR